MKRKKRNKYSYHSTLIFSERIQEALSNFRECFPLSNDQFEIKHFRDDAIFIQIYGMLSAYSITRFVKNCPGFYLEIDPIAPKYTELRIFCSDWMREKEIPRQYQNIDKPFNPRKNEYIVRILENNIKVEP